MPDTTHNTQPTESSQESTSTKRDESPQQRNAQNLHTPPYSPATATRQLANEGADATEEVATHEGQVPEADSTRALAAPEDVPSSTDDFYEPYMNHPEPTDQEQPTDRLPEEVIPPPQATLIAEFCPELRLATANRQWTREQYDGAFGLADADVLQGYVNPRYICFLPPPPPVSPIVLNCPDYYVPEPRSAYEDGGDIWSTGLQISGDSSSGSGASIASAPAPANAEDSRRSPSVEITGEYPGRMPYEYDDSPQSWSLHSPYYSEPSSPTPPPLPSWFPDASPYYAREASVVVPSDDEDTTPRQYTGGKSVGGKTTRVNGTSARSRRSATPRPLPSVPAPISPAHYTLPNLSPLPDSRPRPMQRNATPGTDPSRLEHCTERYHPYGGDRRRRPESKRTAKPKTKSPIKSKPKPKPKQATNATPARPPPVHMNATPGPGPSTLERRAEASRPYSGGKAFTAPTMRMHEPSVKVRRNSSTSTNANAVASSSARKIEDFSEDEYEPSDDGTQDDGEWRPTTTKRVGRVQGRRGAAAAAAGTKKRSPTKKRRSAPSAASRDGAEPSGFLLCRFGCGHKASSLGDMTRHEMSSQHAPPRYKCKCGKFFQRSDSLKRHCLGTACIFGRHPPWHCCPEEFPREDYEDPEGEEHQEE
ncbi:hypothetical protein GLOTRDRAFT_94424 [Gloeophyllum trabeum ATCC 11539]|uniref:C2H2-type domain-containing protein n=1 Tax=Gloeophyllum trabeum (strain ATCC 11539 / FP-39264 / Madison 617) TaxID=670483 RepID=S7RMW3_GLOTA|nr:uncharacterized protein GLOTRDRAFT_94424 [Gloeophyllum trabeum ATCC 11539]EPQ54034.1 hypothetical protein GLOTRDRAFT_94424 [Gloeophyllum trabeum ATCC 11539]